MNIRMLTLIALMTSASAFAQTSLIERLVELTVPEKIKTIFENSEDVQIAQGNEKSKKADADTQEYKAEKTSIKHEDEKDLQAEKGAVIHSSNPGLAITEEKGQDNPIENEAEEPESGLKPEDSPKGEESPFDIQNNISQNHNTIEKKKEESMEIDDQDYKNLSEVFKPDSKNEMSLENPGDNSFIADRTRSKQKQ